jgi:hypothetical protein
MNMQKPENEIKAKELECIKLRIDLETCGVIYDQLTTVFKMRQQKYMQDHWEKQLKN